MQFNAIIIKALYLYKASSWISLSLSPPQSSKFPNSPKVMSLAMGQWHPQWVPWWESLLLSRPHCGAVVSLGSFRRWQSGWALVTEGNSGSEMTVDCWIPATHVGRHWTQPSDIEVLPCGGCLWRKVLQFSCLRMVRSFCPVTRQKELSQALLRATWKWIKEKGNSTC